MRPELQRLHDELTALRAEIAAVEDTARTATSGWTVAQVLEHLAKTNRFTAGSFARALADAPSRSGEDPLRLSWLDRQIVRAMAGRSFKIPVPAMFEPGAAGPEAKAACLDSLDALLQTVAEADGKRLAGLRVTPPVGSFVRIGFLPYLEGTVGHVRYHRQQI